MKPITKLSLRNVKGLTQKFDLSPVTVITGPNGCGKSAVLEAIQANLIGFVPEWGKRPNTTFAMASADTMTVKVELADGEERAAKWSMNSRGTVTAECPPAILSDVTVDLSGFYALTAKERMKMLFAKFAPKDLGSQFRTAVVQVLEDTADNVEGEGCDEAVLESIKTAVMNEVRKASEGDDVAEGIAAAVATFSEMAKGSRAVYDAMTKTLQSQTEVDLDQIDTTSVVTKQQLQEATVAARAAATKAMEAESAVRHAEQTRRQAESAKAQALANVSLLKSTASLSADDLKQAIERLEACEAERSAADNVRAELWSNLRQAEAELNRAESEIMEMTGHDHDFYTCEACGSKVDVALKVKQCSDTVSACMTTVEKVRAELAVATEKFNKADQEFKQAQKVERELNAQHRAHAAVEREAASSAGRLAQAEAQLEEFTDAKLDALRGEAMSLNVASRAAAEKVNQLQQAFANYTALEAKRKQDAQVESRRTQAKAETVIYSELVKGVTKFMEAAVNTSASTLLQVASRLWSMTDCKGTLVWDGDDIAIDKAGRRVTRHAMSGRERILTRIGMQVMIASGGQKGFVIVDEIGRLDSKSIVALVGAFKDMVADGTLTQVLVAGTFDHGTAKTLGQIHDSIRVIDMVMTGRD